MIRTSVYGKPVKPFLKQEDVFESLEIANTTSKLKEQVALLKNKNTADNIEEFIFVIKVVRKYTEGYQSKSGSKLNLGGILLGLLDRSDCSLKKY